MDGTQNSDDDAEQHRQDDAGHDARNQHIADRHLRQRAVHHKHHRGRNDGAQHAAVCGKTGSKGFVVALFSISGTMICAMMATCAVAEPKMEDTIMLAKIFT